MSLRSFEADLPRTVAYAALPARQADTAQPADQAVTAKGQSPGEDVDRIQLPDGTELTDIVRTFAGRLVTGKDPKAWAWISKRIAMLDTDVLCLQEVENQDALEAFCRDDVAAANLTPIRTGWYRGQRSAPDRRRHLLEASDHPVQLVAVLGRQVASGVQPP